VNLRTNPPARIERGSNLPHLTTEVNDLRLLRPNLFLLLLNQCLLFFSRFY
jgi:hypothetical protein